MQHPVQYSAAERATLAGIGALGFVTVNAAFLYGSLLHPELLHAALVNPVSVAFIVEALLLVGVFAYLFQRWGVSRLGWGWFVIFSLLGSLAFAVPVVLLFPRRDPPPE